MFTDVGTTIIFHFAAVGRQDADGFSTVMGRSTADGNEEVAAVFLDVYKRQGFLPVM